MTLNLCLKSPEARVLGVDGHVCELQIVTAGLLSCVVHDPGASFRRFLPPTDTFFALQSPERHCRYITLRSLQSRLRENMLGSCLMAGLVTAWGLRPCQILGETGARASSSRADNNLIQLDLVVENSVVPNFRESESPEWLRLNSAEGEAAKTEPFEADPQRELLETHIFEVYRRLNVNSGFNNWLGHKERLFAGLEKSSSSGAWYTRLVGLL